MGEKEKGTIEVVRLNEPGGEMLDARYYCNVENRKKLNVVIKLKANTSLSMPSQTPQRYVLLMDVSGSMNDKVKGDHRSLLERIKVFAHLFVSKLTDETWISIVTFSNTGNIVLPMTKMNRSGRLLAKSAIESIKTIGMTNISDGLFASLDAINSSTTNEQPTRDCIILFTDGQANEGIIEAEALVDEYRTRVQSMERANQIPVSAITIGDNQPFFLNQVATGLGSDSFYWLNMDCDFEADMLLPMLLREAPCIVDIKLEISCQNDVTFYDDNISSSTLQEKEGNQYRTYFIHIIPSSMEKNLYLSLKLPEKEQQDLDGKIILEVWKNFMDNNLRKHTSTDYLELKLTSMKQILYEAHNIPENELEDVTYLESMDVGPGALDYLEKTASYTKSKDQTGTTWDDAQESMINVLGQQCRLEAISAIAASAELVDQGRESAAKQNCQDAISNIQKIEEMTANVLGKSNPNSQLLQENVKQNFQDKLEFVTDEISNCNPGRLTAMASSIATEMPTATGVFEPDKKQPFMPEHIDKKHDEIKEIVKKITLEAKETGGQSLISDLYPKEVEEEEEEEHVELEAPPEEPEVVPPAVKTVIVYKPPTPGSDLEEYDPDSLFLSSILPDIQQLDSRKKLELKMDILKLLHSALYE